jgi:hypothetical protein
VVQRNEILRLRCPRRHDVPSGTEDDLLSAYLVYSAIVPEHVLFVVYNIHYVAIRIL